MQTSMSAVYYKKLPFYLWNTGLETGLVTPPPPPKKHLDIFRQACFTYETVILSHGGFSKNIHVECSL